MEVPCLGMNGAVRAFPLEMIDVFLPATDAGAAVQFAVVLTVGAVGIVAARQHRDLRLLVVGATVLLVALMALRTVH